MRIACVGGGPAGLYFAISVKLRDRNHEVTVLERNPPGVTYGWGVTFSERLLDSLYRNDPASGRKISDCRASWGNQDVHVRDGRPIHLGGYGYAIGRQRLLDVLTNRAAALGVDVQFQCEVNHLSQLSAPDLIVACDGANSGVRKSYDPHFRATVDSGRNKYIWLGTHRVFDSFIFAFEETSAGWIWFYAYRFNDDTTTFIVECAPATWEGLGFAHLGPEETLQLLQDIFKQHLDGHPLAYPPILNPMRDLGRAPWLNFNRITTSAWYHDNVALMGDAAHTTHFSIGSGTTLAIQDAVALADKLHQFKDLGSALEGYQAERRAALFPAQQAALNSTRWFENIPRHIDQNAVHFAYELWQRRGHHAIWRYPLHLATQISMARKLRCSLSALHRNRQARRRANCG